MTTLLDKISNISKDAAVVLESAGFHTDSEIKSLSRIDLNELLPGPKKLQVRKKVFETIQDTTKPADITLQEEKFTEALTHNGTAVEYRNTLYVLKDQVNQIQMSIDACINLLEGRPKNQNHELIKSPPEVNDEPASVPRCSGASSQFVPKSGPSRPQQTQGIPEGRHQISRDVESYTLGTVMNMIIISGKTLNAHQDVLKQVQEKFRQDTETFQLRLEEKENVEHCDIIIVFCPVVSRIGTDIESAMSQVPDNKDIILVVMHHLREPKTSLNLRNWSRPKHVVLDVNVFFHDTVGGLLNCKENNDAVSEIQTQLLCYMSKRQIIKSQKTLVRGLDSLRDWFGFNQ